MGVWADIRGCTNCDLHKYMICQPVPGFTKNPNPDVMLIGEAPGADECLIEKPFQGMTGKLLNKLLIGAGIERDNIYVTNLVKCRPTIDNNNKKNRPINNNDIQSCFHLLLKEINTIRPKIIISCGILSSIYLGDMKKNTKMSSIIGKEFEFTQIKNFSSRLVPIYHPGFLLSSNIKDIRMCVEILQKCVLFIKGDINDNTRIFT